MTYCLSCFGESCELYNRKISLRKSVCRGESRIPQREGCQSDLLYMWRTPPSPRICQWFVADNFTLWRLIVCWHCPTLIQTTTPTPTKWVCNPIASVSVLVSVCACVGQCEPLHTILYNPFLPAATKLGQGNIFRSVCQEFCPLGGEGVCLSACWDTPPSLGADPPGADPPPGSRLQHTVNERAVRILLECILVLLLSVSGSVNTSWSSKSALIVGFYKRTDR